ncbi:MAG: tetratricopeptide repeat protein [Chloroflexi bacterium]|nr:tetratricopeptide repeat protein [Chloroflexota bacterium]
MYLVPQYLTPRAPPIGADAAPVAAGAPSPSAVPAATRLADADELLADGRWPAAATAFADLTRTDPDLAAAYAGWARALIFANKPAEAVEHAQKAVDLQPRVAEFQVVLALAQDWAGNSDRAITVAQEATELDGTLPLAFAYLAEAYADEYRLPEAEAALKQAQALNGGTEPEVLRVQGYLLETEQDYPSAIAVYQQAVAQAPSYSYLYISLGAALRAQKRYDEAIQAYQKAADLFPQDARAEGGIGAAYYVQEQYGPAEQHLDRAVSIDPTYATGWGSLGWLFYVQKAYDRAQPDFQKAIDLEKDPTRNAQYRHGLGWVDLNLKQYDQARQEFTRALELDPKLDGAHDGLAALDKVAPSPTATPVAPTPTAEPTDSDSDSTPTDAPDT